MEPSDSQQELTEAPPERRPSPSRQAAAIEAAYILEAVRK